MQNLVRGSFTRMLTLDHHWLQLAHRQGKVFREHFHFFIFFFFFIPASKGARLKEFRVSLPQWEHQVKCEISREGKQITHFPWEKMMHADRLIKPLKPDPAHHMAGSDKSHGNLCSTSHRLYDRQSNARQALRAEISSALNAANTWKHIFPPRSSELKKLWPK